MSVQLNRRLALETLVRTEDGAGGSTGEWQVLGTLWAAVGTRGGGTTRPADAGLHADKVRIVLRAAPVGDERRPLPGQRLTGGGHVYRIDAVGVADDAGLYLTCLAHEELAP